MFVCLCAGFSGIELLCILNIHDLSSPSHQRSSWSPLCSLGGWTLDTLPEP